MAPSVRCCPSVTVETSSSKRISYWNAALTVSDATKVILLPAQTNPLLSQACSRSPYAANAESGTRM